MEYWGDRVGLGSKGIGLGAVAMAIACGSADGGAHDEGSSPVARAPASASVAASAVAPVALPRDAVRGTDFPDHVVALTWDDGPDVHTLDLATWLAEHRVSATFFVVGSWMNGMSDDPGDGSRVLATGYEQIPILGDLVALGHRLGNHTLHHMRLREEAGPSRIASELRDNQRNLDPFLTNEVRFFRAPGGGWGDAARNVVDRDPYLATMIGPMGWDIDKKDWDQSVACRDATSPSDCEHAGPGHALRTKASVVAARYVASIERAGHGIVLLHDRVGHVGSSYGLELAQAMIPPLVARGFVFAAPVLRFSPLLVRHTGTFGDVSSADAWDPSSLRAADVNGDGRADVCGHTPSGLRCAIAVTLPGGAGQLPKTIFRAPRRASARLRDAAVASGAIHLADISGDGQADVCVGTREGIACAVSNATGELGELRTWTVATPSAAPVLHASPKDALSFADVDGDGRADACSLGASGVVCAHNAGKSFEAPRTWLAGATASDPSAWHLTDVDGDRKADLCLSTPRGLACAISSGHGFGKLAPWSSVAELGGPALSASLRFGDLNGDGRADVCALVSDGLACAFSTGRAFTKPTVWVGRAAVVEQGWDRAELASTIRLADVNGDGRADLCGTSPRGVVCGLAP
ncbi:MAG: VCBS repeat-containing protein [Deltaproteobacteria bacterium]|nr:VCBS repeat-containing protein [Deltaproteobacteria bacterium]